ncbi:MAG: ATP-binding cassette domain-containing protein [Lachnospiraceae bacterium]|nr:ATP-binding cassette domain-containing protein [Lachnospiraceae bacterium]
MSETIIEVKNAVKKYKETTALDDVSLTFEKGKIYGLIGRNGSGKTVLLRCICGLTRVTSGEVTVNGKVVGKQVDFPDNIGMIIETPGFLPNYSGYKNLDMLACYRKKIGKKEIRETMQRVGLDPDSRKWVGKYSLGMRQRLGIAQAIMEDPDILILDEPMNGLDNSGVEEIRQLLLDLKESGKTIVLASHNREDIAVLCDEVTELDHGKIIAHSEAA